jgi:hypothetical protein
MGGEEFACKYRDQLLHELEDSYLQFKVVMIAHWYKFSLLLSLGAVMVVENITRFLLFFSKN